MLEGLKRSVCKANLDLVSYGLVTLTWGNVSGRDRETGLIVIKPSGADYSGMEPDDMVVVDPEGHTVEGKFRPSTDAPTHLILYKTYPSVGGIVHTHSTFATAWAQAGLDIPPFGTTHADHYHGEVPCTRQLTDDEIKSDYELNTGRVIIERLGSLDPLTVPSALVSSHGPFCWGTDAGDAVHNAVALEEIARMAMYTVLLKQGAPISQALLDRHFLRKHGADAYYGQENNQ